MSFPFHQKLSLCCIDAGLSDLPTIHPTGGGNKMNSAKSKHRLVWMVVLLLINQRAAQKAI